MNILSANKLTKRVTKMKPNLKLKTTLVTCFSGVIAIASFSGIAADYSKAEKELKIMSTIFETALSEGKTSNRHSPFFGRSNSSDPTYLAKQGMVFRFNFSSNQFVTANDWQAFGEGIGQLVGTIASEVTEALSDFDHPAPPVPVTPFGDSDWDVNVEAYEEYQEVMNNLRDEQRDQRREVRDLQRSIRGIEKQARREEQDSKLLEKTKKKLEEKMKVLSKKMESYEKSMKEYRDKKSESRKKDNKKKSNLIISTLCDYGTTLRSLKNDEYVTLIFNNFENDKDQVYVFNYKDVKSCSDSKKLVKRSISYQL